MSIRSGAAVDSALSAYLADVAKVRATGAGTVETSYYPALNALLNELGAEASPRWAALSSPKAIEGHFPDVALYEVRSNVLVLPIEVKGLDADIHTLARSDQAKRYAKVFGGGRVMVTNLRQFAISEMDEIADKLRIVDVVDLLDDQAELSKQAPVPAEVGGSKLAAMLDAATAIRGSIRRPETVADLLAYHGKLMVDAIKATGDPDTLLAPIERSLREGLDMQLDAEMLVPTTVQTLLYGLFAAWLEDSDPENFDWLSASYELSLPVYGEMIHSILTPSFVRKCNLPVHLESAARMLTWVDQAEFAAAFEGGAIEYFYEPFLAAFDGHLRDKLGVWYTPAHIAEYQTARVDYHLRRDLGLANGLADDVYVLDPATGTGTYLTTVLRSIRAFHIANGEADLIASQKAADAAKTRVIGFEILPAAFVIAHININRLLASWGVPFADGERPRVYLTNSLTGWSSGAAAPHMPLEGLEEEIRAALEVKGQEPIIAILGNPPYEGYSSAESDEERALLLPWTESLWSEFGLRKHRLNDLYVRFWRIAVHKISTLTNRGVVSFITNRKWLGGRSYPAMRENICTSFNFVVVDDLHGDVDERLLGDESIFKTRTAPGIKVGTAIVTAVRSDGTLLSGTSPATVHRRDLVGGSIAKQGKLRSWARGPATETMTEALVPIAVSRASRWRFVAPSASDAPGLDEYMPKFFSGVQPVRDEAVLDVDSSALRDRMTDYFDFENVSMDALLRAYPAFGVDRARYDPARVRAKLAELGKAYDEANIVRYAFHPFTHRWLYWELDAKLLNEARRELAANWFGIDGQISVACAQTARRPGAAKPYSSFAVPGFACVDPDARVFTRFIRDDSLADGEDFVLTAPNEESVPSGVWRSSIAEVWIAAAKLAGASDSDEDLADQLFFGLVAVMNSPAWIESQAAQLDDFPTVPLPSDPGILKTAAEVGMRFVELSDPDNPVEGVSTGSIEQHLRGVGVPNDLGPGVLAEGRFAHFGGEYDATTKTLYWDRARGHGWTGVTPDVWAFSIGGFPVIAKYLSYLVGQTLTTHDRETVMVFCRRITEMIREGARADEVFQAAVAGPLEQARPAEAASIL